MQQRITWHDTPGDSIVGYVGGLHMFRIRPVYGKGFFNFKVESYVVATEAKQERSGRPWGYYDMQTLEEAKQKAEWMWAKLATENFRL